MLLQWHAIIEAEKTKCSRLTDGEKFIYFLLLQYRNPYGWGKENLKTADCSGSVCLAIMMSTGCLVRTTSNGLLQKFFTNKKPQEDDIQVAFFVAQTDRRHENKIAYKGDAIHVAGCVGQGVLFKVVLLF